MVEPQATDQPIEMGVETPPKPFSREGKRAAIAILVFVTLCAGMLAWMVFLAPATLEDGVRFQLAQGNPGVVVSRLDGLAAENGLDTDMRALFDSAINYQEALTQYGKGNFSSALEFMKNVDAASLAEPTPKAFLARLTVIANAHELFMAARGFVVAEKRREIDLEQEMPRVFRAAGETLDSNTNETELELFRQLYRLLEQNQPDLAKSSEFQALWPFFFDRLNSQS